VTKVRKVHYKAEIFYALQKGGLYCFVLFCFFRWAIFVVWWDRFVFKWVFFPVFQGRVLPPLLSICANVLRRKERLHLCLLLVMPRPQRLTLHTTTTPPLNSELVLPFLLIPYFRFTDAERSKYPRK
jgi:hypothetical protein